MSESTDIFRLEHVYKVFEKKNQKFTALDDISLSIKKGEIFGIIGMSGAGKSTLVRTLNRLEAVTDGSVYFENQNLSELSERSLRQVRQSMAMIFQGFNLLNQKNVLANVMIAMKIAGVPKEQRKQRAEEMLEIVGLADKKTAYPSELSGGQKQRIAIARALSVNPKVLLCDEATSALDPKITEEILNLLREINQKMKITIVIITHEMSVVEKICNRVAIIDHGRLAEIGNVEDIFTNPETEIAKELVFPIRQELNPFDMTDRRCVRIAFDGHASDEPVIADLVASTGEKVNILCANTKSVRGMGYGQMIIELPKDTKGAEKVLNYLKKAGVFLSEVSREEVGA